MIISIPNSKKMIESMLANRRLVTVQFWPRSEVFTLLYHCPTNHLKTKIHQRFHFNCWEFCSDTLQIKSELFPKDSHKLPITWEQTVNFRRVNRNIFRFNVILFLIFILNCHKSTIIHWILIHFHIHHS